MNMEGKRMQVAAPALLLTQPDSRFSFIRRLLSATPRPRPHPRKTHFSNSIFYLFTSLVYLFYCVEYWQIKVNAFPNGKEHVDGLRDSITYK